MLRSLSFVRRATAVLSGALLLQLSMLASGTLCPMQHGHGHSASIDAPMPLQHAAHHMTDAPAPTPRGSCDMNGSSCRTPWSPAGECAPMSTCATGAAVAPVLALDIASDSPVAVSAAPAASMPVGPSYAPELPPPRG